MASGSQLKPPSAPLARSATTFAQSTITAPTTSSSSLQASGRAGRSATGKGEAKGVAEPRAGPSRSDAVPSGGTNSRILKNTQQPGQPPSSSLAGQRPLRRPQRILKSDPKTGQGQDRAATDGPFPELFPDFSPPVLIQKQQDADHLSLRQERTRTVYPEPSPAEPDQAGRREQQLQDPRPTATTARARPICPSETRLRRPFASFSTAA